MRATSILGIPIEFTSPPHPKYDHNGSLNLVDGIFGSLPWKGSEWLGFREPKIEMILDLETQQELTGCKIGFLENNGSWIYLPKIIRVESSNDKKVWSNLVSEEVSADKYDGTYSVAFDVNARYVKIIVETLEIIPEGLDGAGNIPWTFMDEIEMIYPEE